MDGIDELLGIEDRIFTTAEICHISSIPEKNLRNWLHRGLIEVGGVHFSGRRLYSCADALHLSVMHDLTDRVPLKPSDAANAATHFARYVCDQSPISASGSRLLDVSVLSATLAFALAVVDGDLRAGLVDPRQPGGYATWQGEWGRPHIVLPIAAIVAEVQWRTIATLTARATGRAA